MNKVFVVGLSKTGTTSLHAALEALGLRSIHNPEAMLRIEAGELRLSTAAVANYDALSDLPVAAFFEDLDRAFPGARFILTTRNMDAWLASCANHFDPNAFRPNEVGRKLRMRVYGTETFDRERFRNAVAAHNERVARYFAERPRDLLVIDIDEPDKWRLLCPFLGLPIPMAAYPHENRASRVPPPLKRILRWVRNAATARK